MAATAADLSIGTTTLPEASSGACAERALVAQCRSGDPEAFARLVALHEGMVFGLAVRMLGDPEEARDVSQEVFLQVYRHLGHFEARSSVKTWIYRIVLNTCRNRRRWWSRRRREASLPLEELTVSDEAQMASRRTDPSAFDLIERGEQHERVQAALMKLSLEHRAVLLLKEVEGLPCEVVAATLGVAVGTVKSRLARAREALRVRLVAMEERALP